MSLRQKTCYAFVALILLSACSDKHVDTQDHERQIILPTAEYLLKNPQLLPNFITSIKYNLNAENGSEKLMCLNIWQHALWELGIFAEDLDKYIRRDSQIMIDNELFPIDEFNMQPVGLWHPVYENGKLIGSYGDVTNICVNVTYIDSGVHLGSIRLLISPATEYSYLWAFHTP
ncbi:MAG: hypothetical protein HY862_20300 [Chloroflexi bacterium]|nr:hypothetical protein [Chloroflexota bacterium]